MTGSFLEMGGPVPVDKFWTGTTSARSAEGTYHAQVVEDVIQAPLTSSRMSSWSQWPMGKMDQVSPRSGHEPCSSKVAVSLQVRCELGDDDDDDMSEGGPSAESVY